MEFAPCRGPVGINRAWLARFFCSSSDRQRVETHPSLSFEPCQCKRTERRCKEASIRLPGRTAGIPTRPRVEHLPLWQMGGAGTLKIGFELVAKQKVLPSQSSSGESKSCKPLFKRLWLEWDSNEIHPLVPCVIPCVWKLERANFFRNFICCNVFIRVR